MSLNATDAHALDFTNSLLDHLLFSNQEVMLDGMVLDKASLILSIQSKLKASNQRLTRKEMAVMDHLHTLVDAALPKI